jgi:2-dehydrotetronate isomerase
MKFSANLGFLWADRPLPDAIRAAKAAGFDAVECHWPYAIPAADVSAALDETGLGMLGLNTVRGDVAAGENGLSALPGREAEARAAIDEALAYARATSTPAVHVMAGFSGGPKAHAAFCHNLTYACEQAAPDGITILIEPLNHYDAPGYFLSTSVQAAEIIREINRLNLKLMFDCYHLQIMEGDLTRRLERLLPLVGHIQIAAVPDRGPPDHGELDYGHMLAHIGELGWKTPVGAEYKPGADTNATLQWLTAYRQEAHAAHE